MVEIVDRRKVVRGPAAELILYEGREALAEGPTRSAKSWALMLKADETARNFPEARQLFARQTRKSLNESILKDWRDEILWQGHPAISKTASRDHQDNYHYPNGSEIYFAGLESMQDTASPILSTKWDRIYVVQAEETKEAAWETLATRLSSFKTPYHQMIADCNPAAPSHWLNKRFGIAQETPNRQRFRFRHHDNPLFYDGLFPDGIWTKEGKEYVETLKATLTGVRYKRFYLGQWAAADGLILDNWDPEKHVIDAKLEKSDSYGWFIHAPSISQQPIRVSYFTAGVDWGWHPDPGAMSLWAWDAPRWHKHIRQFRVAEVVKLKWQREEWCALAEHWWEKYGCKQFSCDRSNPEAINYFNLRLGKKIGRSAGAVAVKCPPIGGGHRQDRDKGSQIDLMREGLGSADGHQRTFLFRDAFPEGLDEELRRMGRPTCYEEEVESWIYKRKAGEDRDEAVPDDSCDEHAIDAARCSEVLSFARGFGTEVKEQSNYAPNTWGREFEQMKRERASEKRKGRWGWSK
jgi:PBSX family phage terminase large subunit